MISQAIKYENEGHIDEVKQFETKVKDWVVEALNDKRIQDILEQAKSKSNETHRSGEAGGPVVKMTFGHTRQAVDRILELNGVNN